MRLEPVVAWDERDTWMRRTLMTLSGRLRARWVCVLAAFLRSLVRRIICINTGLAWHETLHTLLTHTAPRERATRTCPSASPRTCPGGAAVCEGTRVETHRDSSRRVGPDHVLTTSSSGPRHVTKDSPAQQLGAGLTWLKTLLKPVPRPHAAAAPRAARSQAH